METAGVPMVALLPLRRWMVEREGKIPEARSKAMRSQLERLLDQGMAALPTHLQEYLKIWRYPNGEHGTDGLRRAGWWQAETFELIVAAGLATWAEWADFWHIDPSFMRDTCLTGLLLQRGFQLDQQHFRKLDGQGWHMRKEWLPLLFSQATAPDFQLYCLSQLVHNGMLDLSGTRLTDLPVIAGELKDITVIDVGGTSISQLPDGLLVQLHFVRGRRAQCRAIIDQAMQSVAPRCHLGEAEQMRLGLKCFQAGRVEDAYHYFEAGCVVLDTPIFKYQPRLDLIEAHLGSAIETGRWQAAVEVMNPKAHTSWVQNSLLRFNQWELLRGKILASGQEELVIEALSALPLGNLTPQQFFALDAPHRWSHLFERLLYKRGLQPALALLDRAQSKMPSLRLSMFRWDRIMGHLKQKRQYHVVLAIYHYLDGPGAWLVIDESHNWIQDPRCIPDGQQALRELGETELLERYLSHTIRRR